MGQSFVPASGHHLNISWFLKCLRDPLGDHDNSTSDKQLLIFSVDEVDRRNVYSQHSGFTVSLDQLSVPPEIVRLSPQPHDEAKDPDQTESWRDPPELLRLKPIAPNSHTYTVEEKSLEDQLEEIRRLEAEVELLVTLLEAKKGAFHSSFKGELSSLKNEVGNCDGLVCAARAVFDKAHGAAKLLYLNYRPNPYRDQLLASERGYWNSATGQTQAKMGASEASQTSNAKALPTRDLHAPPQAHCSDGAAGYQPPEWNEKVSHGLDDAADSVFGVSKPSFIASFFKLLFIISGLAALFNFIRSRRSAHARASRAARREERRAQRASRRNGRRSAISNWWHGRGGRRGRRPGELDEKRQLVNEQEGVLEESMQDEIRQLQITEEIKRLRRAHNTIEELVLAEEGRSRGYPHNRPSMRQNYDAGPSFTPGPFSITIPAPSYQTPYHPPSPLSRTSSLPGYRSDDEVSDPPSYHTDDDDHTNLDAFSDYTPSTRSSRAGSGTWTPISSIPDISSPRPSIETIRTFL